CMAVVSITLVAALSTVSAAKTTQKTIADRQLAQELARALLTEIVEQVYEEPVLTPGFGPEAGEADGTRRAFDDVDDFNGWTANPPQYRDGTFKTGLNDWTETATIERVGIAALESALSSDSGIKRVSVEVQYKGKPLARMVALRTNAWVENLPE
ncbi:MAG: hypothetical protein ACKVS9_16790, partial [Phycisphaerae bacterium]